MARALGLEPGSIGVALLAFTPYMAFSAVIPLLVAAVLRVWIAAAAALLAAVVLLALVLPRAFGGPTEADGATGPTVRILAANMRLGHGDAERLTELAAELDVDLLSVEELTPGLARRLAGAGLGAQLAHRVLTTGDGASGSGLYSRYRLGSYAAPGLPGGFDLISVVPEIPGSAPVEVFSVHTSPPTTPSWSADLGALPPADEGQIRVLAGDFNASLDHAAFRDVLDQGYADAAQTLGAGLDPTWPVGRRVLPPFVTIDHVIADQRVGIRDYSVHDVDGSDHRAVFAELALPAG